MISFIQLGPYTKDLCTTTKENILCVLLWWSRVLQGSVCFNESVCRAGDGLRDDGQVLVRLSPVLLQAARPRFHHGVSQTWKRGQTGGAGRPDHVPAGDTTSVYIYLASPQPRGAEFCTVWGFPGVWFHHKYTSAHCGVLRGVYGFVVKSFVCWKKCF